LLFAASGCRLAGPNSSIEELDPPPGVISRNIIKKAMQDYGEAQAPHPAADPREANQTDRPYERRNMGRL
jgi:hypothetical protein